MTKPDPGLRALLEILGPDVAPKVLHAVDQAREDAGWVPPWLEQRGGFLPNGEYVHHASFFDVVPVYRVRGADA